MYTAKECDFLKKLGVKYILNAAHNLDNLFPAHFHYCNIAVQDQVDALLACCFNDWLSPTRISRGISWSRTNFWIKRERKAPQFSYIVEEVCRRDRSVLLLIRFIILLTEIRCQPICNPDSGILNLEMWLLVQESINILD